MNKKYNFSVTIIGAGSAMPAHNHISATQIVKHRKHYYQIDCCDGAFTRMIELGVPYQNIDAMFISHNHGDHINGLIECLEGFSLGGRTKDLKIYSPSGLKELYKPMLDAFCSDLRYKFEFITLDCSLSDKTLIYEDNELTVESVPLQHAVPCCGFLFREKDKLPHINIDKIKELEIPLKSINNIKNGNDYMFEDGRVVSYEELIIPAEPAHSYAYCSDTKYFVELSKMIKDVDLAFHEASFLKRDSQQAEKFGHSTGYSAGMTAREANIGKLLIGHISARYKSETEVLRETQEVFKNSEIAEDCKTYEI